MPLPGERTSRSKSSTNHSWSLVVKHGENNQCPIFLQITLLTNNYPPHKLKKSSASQNPKSRLHKTINKMWKEEILGKPPIEALLVFLKESNWHCKKNSLNCAVEMQHAPAKLSLKLHLFEYVDFMAQSLCTWFWDVEVDSSGEIQQLFFFHLGSIHLSKLNHHVSLLNETYKTNRYRLPLIHVIGPTATNKTFSVGFCFLIPQSLYHRPQDRLTQCSNQSKITSLKTARSTFLLGIQQLGINS
ncbi:uncharacterized protein VP01_724g3 [Puccinia sorghi]|uniref:Uncharacterized protein n=1 Tax=Puccinia sorghi TaxID=27349 RepID=A0A0L6UD16_9BASI|nr:uncharacterized protein VP01_724g3 [Puccinia sorghi]